MSPLRALLSFSSALSVLALAAHGQAFCLTHTCDPKTDQCEVVDGCNVSGHVLFWTSSTVSFDVQKDPSCVKNLDRSCVLLPDGSPKVAITADTLNQVVTTAFQTWEAVDCGNGAPPKIRLKDLGQIACAKPEYNKDQPNANVITFHDSAWPYSTSSGADTLALTTVFFDGDTGEIYDANVEINSNLDDFSVGGTPSGREVDLQAVLTHELGHFLGLSHSSVDTATMWSAYKITMSTLAKDDDLAICAAMPPDRMTTTDSYVPRHGWSGSCGTPNKGCCSAAVGADGPRSNLLGLWAFGLGLGLCAWRGRSRAQLKRRSARALPR
ncbi:MAG TPA: matrixin family metalloprotease [Polyangiaceae bacterium]